MIGILYNKSIIKHADAPTSLEDLLKPQFRGKIVMPDPTQHTTTAQWLASLEKLLGREKADKYIRDVAAMKPIFVESLLPAAERVASGETPLGIAYVKYVHTFGERGAPIDYVRLGKMMGDGHYVTLSNKAPHPNAGKAFIDFFLGPESMAMLARQGEFVNRRGIKSSIADADKIQFVEMNDLDAKGFAQKEEKGISRNLFALDQCAQLAFCQRIKALGIAQWLEADLSLGQFLERLLQITAVDILERIGRRDLRFFG